MAFIDWLPNYNIGHKVVDQQHQKIVEMVNRLHESVVENRIDDEIFKVIKEIDDYTQYHFKDEEKVMLEVGFPEIKSHIIKHRNLVKKVTAIIQKLKRGEKISVFHLIGFLSTWLREHILIEDRKISKYIEHQKKTETVQS